MSSSDLPSPARPARVSVVDRLRIERYVWTLDSLLYDLPQHSRVSTRREVRQNLLTAATEVGAGQALTQIGSSAYLAREQFGAQFGDRPRHSWVAAGIFAATVFLVATSLWASAALAYGDGLMATGRHLSGTYTWHGIAYLQNSVTYTLTNGRAPTSVAALRRCSTRSYPWAPCSSAGCGGSCHAVGTRARWAERSARLARHFPHDRSNTRLGSGAQLLRSWGSRRFGVRPSPHEQTTRAVRGVEGLAGEFA